MEALVQLGSVQYVASGADQVYLRGLPTDGPRGTTAYLAELILDCSIAAANTGAGGVTTPQDLHNLYTVTADDGATPWGPTSLNGEVLSALHYALTGEGIPYSSDSNGDSQIAISQTGATRRWQESYDFRLFAPGDDRYAFCPPCKALKGGAVKFTFAAQPTNVTLLTMTITVYARVIYRTTKASISRVRTVVQGFNGTGMELTAQGLLLSLLIRNKTANIAAADITALRLYMDGFPALANYPPFAIRPKHLNFEVGVTGTKIAEHFMGIAGDTFIRVMAAYPVDDQKPNLGDLPVFESAKFEFDGSLTVTNYQAIISFAEAQSSNHIVSTWGHCGCSGEDVKNAVPVPIGKGGSVLTSPKLAPFMPIVPAHPSSWLAKAKKTFLG